MSGCQRPRSERGQRGAAAGEENVAGYVLKLQMGVMQARPAYEAGGAEHTRTADPEGTADPLAGSGACH